MISGTTPVCSLPNHRPRAAEARDHLVGDEERVVLTSHLPDGGQELRRRDHVAGGALDRLHDHRGQGPRGRMLEDLPGELRALDSAGRVLEPQRAAVTVGVGRQIGAGQARSEAVLGPVPDQGHGPGGLAVEAAPEREELELPGVGLGQAQGRLHGLRAARVELDLVEARRRVGGDLAERLGAPGGGEGTDRDLVDLVLQDLTIPGMGMAEGVDAHACGQVEIRVPVDVLDHGAFGTGHRDPRQGRDGLHAGGQVQGFPGHHLLAPGARDLGHDARCVQPFHLRRLAGGGHEGPRSTR